MWVYIAVKFHRNVTTTVGYHDDTAEQSFLAVSDDDDDDTLDRFTGHLANEDETVS